MLFDGPADAAAALPALPTAPSQYPRILLLRRPDGFRHVSDSASDNVYMQATDFDTGRAVAQWQGLVDALRAAGHLVLALPGDPDTPEAVFPNNVFATAPGRLIIGAMRHPSRQLEARDAGVRQRLAAELGLQLFDLSTGDWVAELTGSLVIDRGRSLGYCGLSERCDRAGAAAMQRAFGLSTMLCFDLAAGEYHTNVVLSALGSRGLLLHPEGFADPDWVALWRRWHDDALVEVDAAEKAAFAANCIALADDQLWLSATALSALRASTRTQLQRLGWQLHSVELDEIERAGGSLRCMVGEIY